ncbi:DMT family transporter [Chelatococcus sp. SYSU_G07232]|uniref:DMT family transporter n=1 Tax=Chelatococcus albus TaxID=3047466 RepID=A0ABT7AKN6_9HYPH|nr:DMT family transporter [Chelatococcus sp. SYSU_G07232]MDJ1159932.1 DMT family transporter [Chelatococcus sp. SYSU_G07232]
MVRNTSGRPDVGVALAFVCLLLLGLMPIISNGRPAGWGALTFALWLSVWQLLFSLPLLIREWRSGEWGIFARASSRSDRNRTLAVTLFTGTLFGLSTWAYVLAFEMVGATSAAIALQAYPLFAAVLEALLLGRRKSLGEVGFMVLVVAALFHLATRGTMRLDGFTPWFAVALAVPALWSVAHVILRETLVTTPITPNQVTVSRLIVSTSVLLLLAIVIEGPDEVRRAGSVFEFQSFALMMGLAYYLELIVWFNAVRHIDVSIASSITVPAPAVTMVLAAILLGDSIDGAEVWALVVVIVGLFGLLRVGIAGRRPNIPQPQAQS